ncbi:MAG: isopentenyl-diphosphate delta-isomerase [Bacteroidota bacterium]
MSLQTADDPTAATRKQDHIEMAFESQVAAAALDGRFDYEPMLAAHPEPGSLPVHQWLGKDLLAPIWVSSMTGGTEMALTINRNLAKACAEFGLGMGLGSCRPLLYEEDRLVDFQMRPIIGPDRLLFGNLGLAQVERLLEDQDLWRIDRLIDMLELDGLIIHVNPLQEWLQPEGDRFKRSPIEIVEAVIEAKPDLPLMVKEVGQGMGPASLRRLLELPLLALDTAANGGTNFSKLELLRNTDAERAAFANLSLVGHSASEMVDMVNEIVENPSRHHSLQENERDVDIRGISPPAQVLCQNLLISGGVRDFLDGYYLTERAKLPAIYGQASAMLRYAQGDYEDLRAHISRQIRGLELAHAYLRVRA